MLSLSNKYEIELNDTQKVTVYPDDENVADKDESVAKVFYVVPSQPRLRLKQDGSPYFSFVKYKDAGRAAEGAWCIFDVMFTLTGAEMSKVRTELAKSGINGPIKLSAPRYSNTGTVSLLVLDDQGNENKTEKTFVREVSKFTNPSGFGDDIASFALKLTPLGSTLYEKALSQGKGHIQVQYNHTIPARMGAFLVKMKFDTTQTATFLEEITSKLKKDKEPGGLAQVVNEGFTNKRTGTLEITNSTGKQDDSSFNAVRTWATGIFQKECEATLEKLAGVTPDERKKFEDMAKADAAANGGKYDVGWFWYWHYNQTEERKSSFKRDVTSSTGFQVDFRENTVFDFIIYPQGMLDNVCTLKKASGELVKWSDVCQEISGTDEFFREIRGKVFIAWEDALDVVASVQVFVKYGAQPIWSQTYTPPKQSTPGSTDNKPTEKDYHFQFNYEKGQGDTFNYYYEVRYVSQPRFLKTGWHLNHQGDISITALGILAIDVMPGNLAIKTKEEEDSAECCLKLATIKISYLDKDKEVDISRNIVFQPDHGAHHSAASDASAESTRSDNATSNIPMNKTVKIREPVFTNLIPVYSWEGMFYYENELIFNSPTIKTSQKALTVNDPLYAFIEKKIAANFDNENINHIDVTLNYKDTKNGYAIEKKHVFVKEPGATEVTPLIWRIPVAGGAAGICTIAWETYFKKNTQIPPEKIAAKAFEGSRIEVGPVNARLEKKEVKVKVPEVDWDEFWNNTSQLKLKLTLTIKGETEKPETVTIPAVTIEKPEGSNEKAKPIKTFEIFQDNFAYKVEAIRVDNRGNKLPAIIREGDSDDLTVFLSLPVKDVPKTPSVKKEVKVKVPGEDWNKFWENILEIRLKLTFTVKGEAGTPDIQTISSVTIEKPEGSDVKSKPIRTFEIDQDKFKFKVEAIRVDNKGNKLPSITGEGSSDDLTVFLRLPEIPILELIILDEDWDNFWAQVYSINFKITLNKKSGDAVISESIKKPTAPEAKGKPLKTIDLSNASGYQWQATYTNKKGKKLPPVADKGDSGDLTIILPLPETPV